MAQWLVNMPLTGFDVDGWHDRLLIARVSKGIVSYIVHVKLGSAPLTVAALEAAHTRAAKSQDAIDVSARKEVARRR